MVVIIGLVLILRLIKKLVLVVIQPSTGNDDHNGINRNHGDSGNSDNNSNSNSSNSSPTTMNTSINYVGGNSRINHPDFNNCGSTRSNNLLLA